MRPVSAQEKVEAKRGCCLLPSSYKLEASLIAQEGQESGLGAAAKWKMIGSQ